jgi:hypothetical protein
VALGKGLKIKTMKVHFNSTAIASADYNPETARLTIWFASGTAYSFYRVPERIFHGLRQASSKGSYYNSYIRGRFQP